VYAVTVTVTNQWSEADLLHFDTDYDIINGLPDEHGRAVLVAGKVLEKDPDWLQIVGFVVGGGRMDLVAHNISRTPSDWNDPLVERDEVLGRYFQLVSLPSEATNYLTTAVVRSAATSELEMHVRRYMNSLEWDGRTVAQAWYGDAVDVGPSRKSTGPAATGGLVLRAKVAQRYVVLCAETTKPFPVLEEEFGYARNTLSSYLNMARKEGLLTRPAGRGKPGGRLTELAKQVLSEAESSGT
jgi:hypothetical protein